MKNKNMMIGIAVSLGVIGLIGAGVLLAQANDRNTAEYGNGRYQGEETADDEESLRPENRPSDSVTYDTPDVSVTFKTEDYTLGDMLNLAIQDEYAAYAEYELILDAYGSVNPFRSIINAESSHIDELTPLFATYGIALPVNDAADKTVLPISLDLAYDLGVQAEVNNIAMYDRFLQQELPDDVRAVFQELRDASVNHLNAFSRNAAKY